MADQDNDEGEWTESGNRVRNYRFRNKLKEKAGGGARQDGYVDEAALKRAESTFKKASDQYPKLVESSVAALANACAQALAQPPDERGGEFKKINALAHDPEGPGRDLRVSTHHNLCGFTFSIYRRRSPANR